MNELGLPAGTEALDPIAPQYYGDLIAWTAIGARTSESQTHREMSSGLSTPVGFKNGTDGDIEAAVNAILSAGRPHSFLGINGQGRSAIVRTRGNRYGHLVLRGGGGRPNFDTVSISLAEEALAKARLPRNLVVDCSHANSWKKPELQPLVHARRGAPDPRGEPLGGGVHGGELHRGRATSPSRPTSRSSATAARSPTPAWAGTPPWRCSGAPARSSAISCRRGSGPFDDDGRCRPASVTNTRPSLARFAWLSIAAAVVTIVLKTAAWLLTGSVGLLSDAAESVVNLVAAVTTLGMLTVAARPPDEEHAYGHDKAEYFASGVEGALILVAAVAIAWSAVNRLLHPAPHRAGRRRPPRLHRRLARQPGGLPRALPGREEAPLHRARGRRAPPHDRRLDLGGRARRHRRRGAHRLGHGSTPSWPSRWR